MKIVYFLYLLNNYISKQINRLMLNNKLKKFFIVNYFNIGAMRANKRIYTSVSNLKKLIIIIFDI